MRGRKTRHHIKNTLNYHICKHVYDIVYLKVQMNYRENKVYLVFNHSLLEGDKAHLIHIDDNYFLQ